MHRQVWDAEKEFGDMEEALEGAGKPYMLSFALQDTTYQHVLQNVASCNPGSSEFEDLQIMHLQQDMTTLQLHRIPLQLLYNFNST